MPIYEYECQQCHKRFDRLENVSQEPLEICPSCGGEVHRLVSETGGFTFKGALRSVALSGNDVTRCGSLTPCCGRDTPCEKRPCD